MLPIIVKAAEQGAKILRQFYQQHDIAAAQNGIGYSNKRDHTDIVTDADVASQKAITNSIEKGVNILRIPKEKLGFIGEENQFESVGEHMFIIDPLDGTSNFATGTQDFCVLIAYFHRCILTAGVMYFPLSGNMYVAEKGKGAYLIQNDKKIILKDSHRTISDSFLYTSLSYRGDYDARIDEKIIRLQSLFRGVRMIGSAGSMLALMTHGIAGAVLLTGCSIWDLAPGKLILSELGHEVYDWQGNQLQFDLNMPRKVYPFLACHPSQKEKLFALMK